MSAVLAGAFMLSPGNLQNDVHASPRPVELRVAQAPGWNLSLQAPQAQLDETQNAYELRVPLQHPEDEKQVKINVLPHRIEVAGKFPLTSPDGKQVIGHSSFMKSFTPAQEVLPNKVTRTVKKDALLITIAKKNPDTPKTPNPKAVKPPVKSPPVPGNGLSPQIRKQLEQNSHSFI